jgi:hypothetical protein
VPITPVVAKLACRFITSAQQNDSALEGPGVSMDQLQLVANKMSAHTLKLANVLLGVYEDYAPLQNVILEPGYKVAKHFLDFLYEMRNLHQKLDDRFADHQMAG